jgi:hypothetical protein
MKIDLSVKATLFFLFCLVCTTGALGQVGVGGAPMGPTYDVPDHPMHASSAPMAQTQSLFVGSGLLTIAQGELPLWEVAPKHKEIPLGDTARQERKEHETAKKARVVWEN